MWIYNLDQNKIINTDVVHTMYIKDEPKYDFKNKITSFVVGMYADDDLIETFETKEEAQERLNYFVCELNAKEVK